MQVRVYQRVAEAPHEALDLRRVQRLLGKEERNVLQIRRANRTQRGLVQLGAEVDTAHLRTAGTRKRAHFNRVRAHIGLREMHSPGKVSRSPTRKHCPSS